LGELTALTQTPWLDLRGLLLRKKTGGEGRGGGRERKRPKGRERKGEKAGNERGECGEVEGRGSI